MNLRTPFYLHVFIEKTRKGKQRYIDTYLRSTRFFFAHNFFLCLWLCLRDWDSCRVDHAIGYVEHARIHERGVQIVHCAYRI